MAGLKEKKVIEMPGTVSLTVNASGAAEAAKQGNVVLIVDVIDMSTTLETVLDAGALQVFGASPQGAKAPVKLNPGEIGNQAAIAAKRNNTGLIVISEPRVGTDEERLTRCQPVINAAEMAGIKIEAVYPNFGAETAKLGNFRNKVVIAVTDTGGVAFDAAYTAGAPAVVTGTIARTLQKKGFEPVRAAAKRAIEAAIAANASGITVAASSANSLEDLLAAEYIMRVIIEEGYTRN